MIKNRNESHFPTNAANLGKKSVFLTVIWPTSSIILEFRKEANFWSKRWFLAKFRRILTQIWIKSN